MGQFIKPTCLSRGKFGEVKQCRERKTGRDLAAKFIEINGPQDRFDVQVGLLAFIASYCV